MRNGIIGIIIGIVLGMVLGSSVIAPSMAPPPLDVPPAPEKPLAEGETAVTETLKSPTHRWNLASALPPDLPLYGAAVTHLVDHVTKILDGDLEIRLYKPDALVPIADSLQAVASGTIEAAFAPSSFWAEQSPTLGLIGGAPFGPPPWELLSWFDRAGGKNFHRQAYKNLGVVAMICGLDGPRGSGWFSRPLVHVNDFKGMKIGATGLEGRLFRHLGADVRPLTPADMVTAMKLNVVDAVVGLIPSADQSLGLGQQAPYSYWPAWHHQGGFLDLVINPKAWEALSPRLQDAVRTTCDANVRQGLAVSMDQFQALKAQQMSKVPPAQWPKPILDELQRQWEMDREELAAADNLFAQAQKSLTRFRRNFAIWQELTTSP
ncbi:TRAP transporter substrate-binding protein [Magnetospira thiophila]